MSAEQQEYVIAPWGGDSCDTEIVVVELPSREVVVQLEVPSETVERMAQLGDCHGIPVERALAERLELNRARISLSAAKASDEVGQVRHHLTEAREFLSGVEAFETGDVDAEIERVWNSQLDPN